MVNGRIVVVVERIAIVNGRIANVNERIVVVVERISLVNGRIASVVERIVYGEEKRAGTYKLTEDILKVVG